MLGAVVSYNPGTNKGLVKDKLNNVYVFDGDSLDGAMPFPGMPVYFELSKMSKITNRIEKLKQILPVFQWESL